MKILGGRKHPAVRALDGLAGGLLLAGTAVGGGVVLNLFDAKGEFVRLSRELLDGLSDRLTGLSRYGRTERLEAAHTVLALVAFFEALEAAGLELSAPEASRGPEESGPIGVAEVLGERPKWLVKKLLDSPVRALGPVGVGPGEEIFHFFDHLGGAVWDYLRGMGLAEDGAVAQRALDDEVPRQAVRRYEDLLLRFVADFPDVAFWLNRAEQRTARREVRTGLVVLEELLDGIARGRLPDDRRRSLELAHRAALTRRIVRPDDVPAGMSIPALGDAYIDHRFRAAWLGTTARPDHESWWAGYPVRDDLPGFLLGHLTSPEAVWSPLLVLGQPGSGKSVLTTALAARLPASDFMVVRVVLRDVPAEADLQAQVERAIYLATGETLSWPDLARSAGDALPVILLDGFDELLQATGVSQSDYLERVAAFQEREYDQGRPVAVLVTSRTAVADRARVPSGGAAVVRLESFDDLQVGQWLAVWNDANAASLAARGLRPLSADAVLARPELARQPLLLLMLAVYDADANALQREGDDLDQAGLYERLVTRFAEREIAKTGTERAARNVEEELRRLSVAAFAMFNRGRQWVTEDELNADLTALAGERAAADGLRTPLTAAQLVVGRFFFTHHAEALRDGRTTTTCEFLHATFGEYLVARLIVRELADLAEIAEFYADRPHHEPPGDSVLHAMLSFAPLSGRTQVLVFLGQIPVPGRDRVRDLLLGWFRTELDTGTYAAYEPARLKVTARHATHSANLLLLAGTIGGRRITGRELFPYADDVRKDWRDQALLWRSQLGGEGWGGLARAVQVHRLGVPGDHEISVEVGFDIPVLPPTDPSWGMPPGMAGEVRRGDVVDRMWPEGVHRERRLLCSTDDHLLHALEPLMAAMGHDTFLVRENRPGHAVSASNAVLRLWIAATGEDDHELAAAYEDLLPFADRSPFCRRALLERFGDDTSRLPPGLRRRLETRSERSVGPQ